MIRQLSIVNVSVIQAECLVAWHLLQEEVVMIQIYSLINPYNSFNNPDAKPAFNLHPTKQPSEIVVDDY